MCPMHAGRLLIGVNSGINMVVAPMYLTECAPVEYRGVFGTLGQFGVVTSMLLSQVIRRLFHVFYARPLLRLCSHQLFVC